MLLERIKLFIMSLTYLTYLTYLQIILDVPTVGGRLMLVDMAGSENIEQAGQTGFEAKMQVKLYLLNKFA